MFPRAPALYLDKISWGKNGTHQTEVEDIGAIVSGGHHAYGYADPRFTGNIGAFKISGTGKPVVGKIDGELLGVAYPGTDLNGKIGVVFSGKQFVGVLVQQLGNFGRVILGYTEHNGFACLAAYGVPQGMVQKGPAEGPVGTFGKEFFFKVPGHKYFFNDFIGFIVRRGLITVR
jgi:hypothetical protein